MSWTSKEILSLIELIIYATMTPLLAYTLHKHRSPSNIGHLYMFIFVTLRLVADGLMISQRGDSSGSSTTAAIINSIGLSPLLLATAGFIEEARYYMVSYAENDRARKFGYITDLLLHILVVTGVALLATGSSKAASASVAADINMYRALSYTGAISLLTAWLLICAWGFWTWKVFTKRTNESGHYRFARLLLTEMFISLPFTGVRVCYSVVYTFDRSPNLNPATSSFVVAFFLIFLVQLISATIILLGLVVTRNIRTSNSEQTPILSGNGSVSTRADKA